MPTIEQFNHDLRKASGEVSDSDPLTYIFYHLMRDHVPSGVLADLVVRASNCDSCLYTNGHQANMARHFSDIIQRAALSKSEVRSSTTFEEPR